MSSSAAQSKATQCGHINSIEQKRTALLKLRVTPGERDRIRQAAECRGISVSEYIRARTLNQRLKDDRRRGEVIRELARITSSRQAHKLLRR